jgi:hypothetical protein
MGQFRMLGAYERRHGGQGVVQFAMHVKRGAAVAIKFFLNRKSFDCEEALYMREDLRAMMPAITMIENNDSVRYPSSLCCVSLLICVSRHVARYMFYAIQHAWTSFDRPER